MASGNSFSSSYIGSTTRVRRNFRQTSPLHHRVQRTAPSGVERRHSPRSGRGARGFTFCQRNLSSYTPSNIYIYISRDNETPRSWTGELDKFDLVAILVRFRYSVESLSRPRSVSWNVERNFENQFFDAGVPLMHTLRHNFFPPWTAFLLFR